MFCRRHLRGDDKLERSIKQIKSEGRKRKIKKVHLMEHSWIHRELEKEKMKISITLEDSNNEDHCVMIKESQSIISLDAMRIRIR